MGYLDFNEIKSQLKTLKTEQEVIEARDKLLREHRNLSGKQVGAIKRIFSERTDEIDDELNGVEHYSTTDRAF